MSPINGINKVRPVCKAFIQPHRLSIVRMATHSKTVSNVTQGLISYVFPLIKAGTFLDCIVSNTLPFTV